MEHLEMISKEFIPRKGESNCSDDQDNTNRLYQIKKRQQTRFKQYWKELQRQNSELIKRMAQLMKESHEQIPTQSIKILNLLLLQPKKIENILPKLKQLIYVLMKMLKATILNVLDKLPCHQINCYQEIRKMDLKLAEIGNKNRGCRQKLPDYTIKDLFHLDVASILLKQNSIFNEKWWYFEKNLWTAEEIKQISQLKTRSTNLYKIYQSYQDYLSYNTHKQINDIISVLTLVKIRAKLSTFLRQSSNKFPFLLDIENERQLRQRKRIESEGKDIYLDIRFNFSQLANFSIQFQVQEPPFNSRVSFYQTLHSIMKQPSLWKKKYLILSTKIKYSISIGSILKSLNHFRQIDEQQFTQQLEKAVQEENLAKSEKVRAEIMCDTFMNFKDKWKYIFLTNYTFREAFDKYGISQDINLIMYTNQNACMHRHLRNYIHIATLERFTFYAKDISALTYYSNRSRPLIAIKKYEFAYEYLRTESISEEPAEDSTRTLILATVNTNILFFYLLKGKVTPYKYFEKVRQGIEANPIQCKFIAILFELYFEQDYSTLLKEHQKFINYLVNYYDSFACISNQNKHCNTNYYVSITFSMLLKKLSEKMTKDKFYVILEDQVIKNLPIPT